MNPKVPTTGQPKPKPDQPLIDLPDEYIREVEERLPDEFRNLPHQVREETIEVTTALSVEYLGVIPPPFIIDGWEKILPGAADRFMRMAEKDQAAQLEDVSDRRRRDDRFRLCGLVAGSLVILAQFGCAIAALYAGYPWIAGAFLATGVGSVLAAFVQFMRDGLSQSDAPQKPPPPAPKKPKTPRQTAPKPKRK